MSSENPLSQLAQLTERQREVLRLFCSGLDYKAIADRLFIAVPTVKTHMGNIYVKLGTYHLPPPRRKIVLVQQYCPLLKTEGLPPAQPDAAEEPEPVPESVMRMVEEDEKALIPWEPRQPVTIIEAQPVRVIERLPPPRPKWLPWLLVGVVLGTLLAACSTAGVIYAFRGLLWAQEEPQATPAPKAEYGEVATEVTTAPVLPAPTSEAIVEATATLQDTLAFTPLPTDTPLPPTPTPTPTDTPIPTPIIPPDTPPGTILEVGEAWRQNGVRVKLEEVRLFPSGEAIALMFNLFNDTDHEIVVTINEDQFTLEDNLGRRWRLCSLATGYLGCGDWDFINEYSETVRPGKRFPTPGYDSWKVSFAGYVTDTNVDEVIVVVDGLSQITNARWRVPIYN
jgi:DNA-binding CsgD family transcriptional regulator